MEWFTDLAHKYIEFDDDRSFPAPELELFWRLDDLHDKLEELKTTDSRFTVCLPLTDDDIRYAIPDYFGLISDVERAIELAFHDLKHKYNIDIIEEVKNRQLERNQPSIIPIPLVDFAMVQHLADSLKAA